MVWRAGALKCRPRDRFIGWKPSQQHERLHLVVNNARLLLLPEPGVFPSPGSWFAGRMLRRLSDDGKATCGQPLELAETLESLKATDRERDAQQRFTDVPEKPLHGRRDTRSIECISPLDNLFTIPHLQQMFLISREGIARRIRQDLHRTGSPRSPVQRHRRSVSSPSTADTGPLKSGTTAGATTPSGRTPA